MTDNEGLVEEVKELVEEVEEMVEEVEETDFNSERRLVPKFTIEESKQMVMEAEIMVPLLIIIMYLYFRNIVFN